MRRSARSTTFRTILAGTTFAAFAFTATACGTPDDTSLRQLPPGSTVFIDPWDEDGDRGDKAQIEQLPAGAWMLDNDQTFSNRRDGDYKVQIHLTEPTVVNGKQIGSYWEVLNLNGVKVGYDHDNCLPENGGWAVILDKKMRFENGAEKPAKPKPGARATTGDCARGGDSTKKH